MRTTLTLDSDLARLLKEKAHQRQSSFREVVNVTIRAGLAADRKPGGRRKRFKVKSRHLGFQPGIDIRKLNQLVDSLEVEDFLREMQASRLDDSS